MLLSYISHPETLNEAATAHLSDLVGRYPYFHAARILYLSALYQRHSPMFDEELRRHAGLLPDRRAIFRLFEEKSYQPRPERTPSHPTREDLSEAADLTGCLIDSYLDSLPEEHKPHRPARADATVDYMSYLLQEEEASETPAQEDHPEETASPTKEDSIINDFLSGPEEGRIVLDDHSGKQLVTPQLVEETGTENDIFTEALARIYIKQGKYDRAIEIIRRLSLKYPKKNRYFADQIRFLEKLIINNNNK